MSGVLPCSDFDHHSSSQTGLREPTHSRGDNSISSTNSTSTADGLFLACRAAEIADEFRGEDVIVLDTRELTPIFDFFVVATGSSRRQMHAIAEEVDSQYEGLSSPRLGREGYNESEWILQDYGDIVLHVFTQATREAYDLESLWSDAIRIDWKEELNRMRSESASAE